MLVPDHHSAADWVPGGATLQNGAESEAYWLGLDTLVRAKGVVMGMHTIVIPRVRAGDRPAETANA